MARYHGIVPKLLRALPVPPLALGLVAVALASPPGPPTRLGYGVAVTSGPGQSGEGEVWSTTTLERPWAQGASGPDRARPEPVAGDRAGPGTAPMRVTRAWPARGDAFEGWRPLSRRFLAKLVGRSLRRFQRALEYPSVEAPPDVAEEDLDGVVRALASGTMQAPGGQFRPGRTVTRLELALVLDRLGRSCRGWPVDLPRRRFSFPKDLNRPRDQRDAVDRMLRYRVMRSEKGRFRPRATVSRYGAAIALDRLLTVLGTRPERSRVEYPDVAPNHYARRALRDLYARGILGPPLVGEGRTRRDPLPHRLKNSSREPVLPLAARPYRVRSDLDLATSELPAARELDQLGARVQDKDTRRQVLAQAWDRLRALGKDSGSARSKLLRQVREARRDVGRLHLAMGRLYEELPRSPRGSQAASLRVSLAPAVRAGRREAKRSYQAYTRLYDQIRGAASVPLPDQVPPALPLAARGTPLAGILPGGLVTAVAASAVDKTLALAPATRPRGPSPGVETRAPGLPGGGISADLAESSPSSDLDVSDVGALDALEDELGDDLGDELGDDLEGDPMEADLGDDLLGDDDLGLDDIDL